MSTSTNGRAREYRVRDKFIDAGWRFIMRAAASKGSADLLMAHADHGAALIQVGTGGKYMPPSARLRFLTDAAFCGALPLVAITGPKGMRVWVASLERASKWEPWEL